MKLILVITTVKNGYRIKPNLASSILSTSPDAEVDLHEDEYVFESLDHLTAWLPTFLAEQFLRPKEPGLGEVLLVDP